MAQDYTEWLAANVLNEQQLVSYRSLSRALKVHSNLAKQMLYDFHQKQNSKKPGSVHATYLITGTKRHEVPHANGVHKQRDGEDTVMRSSPPLPSSSMPMPDRDEGEDAKEVVIVRTVMLCKQEHLEQAKATFESITGIHVYSLQANGLGDMQTLTECNRKIAVDYASEDPLQAWKQYGTIQNPNVWRRTGGRRPPPPAAPAEVKAKPSTATTTKPAVPQKQSSKDSQESKLASKPSSAKATPEPAAKKPTSKRENSDIFKSFAKGKTKPKKEDSQASAEASATEKEDEPMNDFSDEDADADEGAEADVVEQLQGGKSKKDREAELQAMMEQEDEEMEDAAPEKTEADEEEADEAIDKPKAEEPKETMTVENGRRRGRRRVMKKKTVKDEDGYLVTKEEAAWESFSEDEPAPKKVKVSAAPATSKASAGKKGAKPGQGNIMSFFSKK